MGRHFLPWILHWSEIKSFRALFLLERPFYKCRAVLSRTETKQMGNTDVGDGCWRRNVLVTTLRWWWRVWPFWSPTCKNSHHLKVINIPMSPTSLGKALIFLVPGHLDSKIFKVMLAREWPWTCPRIGLYLLPSCCSANCLNHWENIRNHWERVCLLEYFDLEFSSIQLLSFDILIIKFKASNAFF